MPRRTTTSSIVAPRRAMNTTVSEYKPRGLNAYFAAVSARGLTREDKLEQIVDCFSDNTVLVSPNGAEMNGHEGVRAFYGSALSPVLQSADFSPRLVGNSMCWSEDGLTCAVILDLPDKRQQYQRVGDFFEFDATTGKIKRLDIFSRQQHGRQGDGRSRWIACCMTVVSLLQAALMMRKKL